MSDEVVDNPTEETTPTLEELADAVNTLTESIDTLNTTISALKDVTDRISENTYLWRYK
jgi:methyl-accepting chemotaxis protein